MNMATTPLIERKPRAEPVSTSTLKATLSVLKKSKVQGGFKLVTITECRIIEKILEKELRQRASVRAWEKRNYKKGD